MLKEAVKEEGSEMLAKAELVRAKNLEKHSFKQNESFIRNLYLT